MLLGCRCRCSHTWLPRESGEKPRVCPKCKSPRWDLPKKFVRAQSVAAQRGEPEATKPAVRKTARRPKKV